MSQITILLSSEAFDILTVYLVKELPSIWVLVPKDVCDFGLLEESSTTRWMGFPLDSLLDTGVMSGNQFWVRQYGIIIVLDTRRDIYLPAYLHKLRTNQPLVQMRNTS